MDNTVMERKDHSLVMKILFKATELVIAKGTDGKVDYEKSEFRMMINAFAATAIGEAAAGKIRLFVTWQRTPRCKSSLASWGSFFVRTPAGLAAALPRTFHNDVISGLSDHISYSSFSPPDYMDSKTVYTRKIFFSRAKIAYFLFSLPCALLLRPHSFCFCSAAGKSPDPHAAAFQKLPPTTTAYLFSPGASYVCDTQSGRDKRAPQTTKGENNYV